MLTFLACKKHEVEVPGKRLIFKLSELLGDPGSVFISGNTDPWVGSTQWYYASGSYLLNPFNTFQWSFNLYQGSFVFGNLVSGGGTNSEAVINWTGISCGQGAFGSNNPYSPCYRLSIGGYSSNPCSGRQGWGSAQVGITP